MERVTLGASNTSNSAKLATILACQRCRATLVSGPTHFAS
jgi:hypothetical protein